MCVCVCAVKRLLQMEVQASKHTLGSVYPRLLPDFDGFLKIRYVVATNLASSRLV